MLQMSKLAAAIVSYLQNWISSFLLNKILPTLTAKVGSHGSLYPSFPEFFTFPVLWHLCVLVYEIEAQYIGRDPFNQNFRKFRSKTQWIGSVQPEKFRKNGSTFWGGPLFPVWPVGILVEWIAPITYLNATHEIRLKFDCCMQCSIMFLPFDYVRLAT